MSDKYIGVPELVKRYAKKHNVTLEVARKQVTGFIETLEESLLDTNYKGVQIKDFITLKRVQRTYVSNLNFIVDSKNPKSVKDSVSVTCSKGKSFDIKLQATLQ